VAEIAQRRRRRGRAFGLCLVGATVETHDLVGRDADDEHHRDQRSEQRAHGGSIARRGPRPQVIGERPCVPRASRRLRMRVRFGKDTVLRVPDAGPARC
jgi:hypothetical protein